MRILVCNPKDIAHPDAGSAEAFTDEITRRWAAWGHTVTLFVATVPGRPDHEHRRGVEIIRRGTPLSVYREARRFYEREAPRRFDVVIDEVSARPFGSPTWSGTAGVVGLVHELGREVWFDEAPAPVTGAGRLWLEPGWLHAFRDTPTLTISPSSRASLEAMGLRQVRVVPTGCEVPLRESVSKESAPTLVFVGRLGLNTRPDHALAAFAAVRGRWPDAKLWMVGTGPLEPKLRRRAAPGVTFFGPVSQADRLDLMGRAHALVVTSVGEGWGSVVDEAAACGTRTIAYDVAGLQDSVPAAHGVLVPPNPTALASHVLTRVGAWTVSPPTRGWRGGARPWDTVATKILDHIYRAPLRPLGPCRRSV